MVVHIGTTWRTQLNHPCAVVTWPFLSNYYDHLFTVWYDYFALQSSLMLIKIDLYNWSCHMYRPSSAFMSLMRRSLKICVPSLVHKKQSVNYSSVLTDRWSLRHFNAVHQCHRHTTRHMHMPCYEYALMCYVAKLWIASYVEKFWRVISTKTANRPR